MVTVVLEIWVLTHLQEHERAREREIELEVQK